MFSPHLLLPQNVAFLKVTDLTCFHTGDLACNWNSAIIIMCFCLSAIVPHMHATSSTCLLTATYLSFATFLSPVLAFSVHMQAVTRRYGCLTGDRWHRFHLDRVSLLQSAASLGWRIGEITALTSHYLCSHKALTSSAACNCFDNLITSNYCGGSFISGWHIIALLASVLLKAVIRI